MGPFPTCRCRSRRTGHTLVEVIVALAISTVVLVTIYSFRFGGTEGSGQGAATEAAATADLQNRLRQLTVEIQQATRVFYPLPGAGDQEGLAIVNIQGETVLYHKEPVSGKEYGQLFRVNVHHVRATGQKPESCFLDRVRRFRVSVAQAEPGKHASLVNLELGVEIDGQDPARPQVLSYVTAAFLRNLENTAPDDLFAPGTPLRRVW